MAKIENERLVRVVKQEPAILSPQENDRMVMEAIALLQQAERNNIGRDKVIVAFGDNEAKMILGMSDLHLGSIATNHKMIFELRDYVLSTPNVGIILLGDEIEGIKQEYLNTNTARTPIDFQQQVDILRSSFLTPLAKEGRILAMVGGYFGHPGWAEDATTINIWRLMSDGLNIPVLRNGGELEIVFANGHKQSETIYHNPPKGSNGNDPVGGLRAAALATSESSRTNGYWSGHIHKVAVAKEIYAGAKFAITYISSGTAKGSTGEVPPDRFGVKLALPLSDELGQGKIYKPRTKTEKAVMTPFVSMKQGRVAFEAIRYLDRTEQQGMTKELMERIASEVEKAPEVNIVPGTSVATKADDYLEERPAKETKSGGKMVENPYSNMTMRAPYDKLTYDIKTQLPIALHLISNVRYGCTSEGHDRLMKYQRDLILNDPHSLVLYLRNMIDSEAGNSPERMAILNKLAKTINGSQEQSIAILMDESLRKSAWKNQKGESAPVAPGSWLANETKTPLLRHLSLIRLAIGPGEGVKSKVVYSGVVADKTQRNASYTKPEWGLDRTYDLFIHEKPGFVVGGATQNAGAMMLVDGSNAETKNPILVAPGWFAKYVDTMGKGNVMPGAEPGQAIIFMPGSTRNDYLAFPTVSAEETENMKDALTLLKGLEILERTNPGIMAKVLKRK